MSSNTFVRSLHDLGAAAWFGGGLMGAIGLNGASEEVEDPRQRVHTASMGWAKWAPVNALAIGAHLVGGAGLLLANRGRVQAQEGVTANTVVKTALTIAALGTTAWSGMLGTKIAKGSSEPAHSGVTPSSSTSDEVAAAQRQERILQWVTPVLVGTIIVLGAQQGEMQRPTQVSKGLLGRILD